MNLGAMIDLGVDREYLIDELNKLNLTGWELIVEKDQRHGITRNKSYSQTDQPRACSSTSYPILKRLLMIQPWKKQQRN